MLTSYYFTLGHNTLATTCTPTIAKPYCDYNTYITSVKPLENMLAATSMTKWTTQEIDSANNSCNLFALNSNEGLHVIG